MAKLNFVVFGITSNLAQIKLVPALYDLWSKGVVEDLQIIGLSHRERPIEELKTIILKDIATKHNREKGIVDEFFKKFKFVNGDFADPLFYEKLKTEIKTDGANNYIYFLATHPDYYKNIFSGLKETGLNEIENGWVRLMIEKPLGVDMESARELNKLLAQYFCEDQIFRIDHYLGKEIIQNLLAFRFNNDYIENGLSKETVDHIQVTISETVGVEDRIGFFDNTGQLRDIGQNHLLQLIAFTLMSKPKSLSNDDITCSRVGVFEDLVPKPESLVLGQYENYPIEGSQTNTYFAFKTELKNGKFAGVPIYARGGKRMSKEWTEVAVVLKNKGQAKNILIYRMKPSEGIVLTVGVKKPGYKMEIQEGAMQFCFKNINQNIINPYEKLILDVVSGDQTYFNDAIEVEKQWEFIDTLQTHDTPLHYYPQGSWGPKEADDMIKKDKKEWLEPTEDYCKF